MVPLAGLPTYERFRHLNRWTDAYLPNASGSPRRLSVVEPGLRRTRRVVEAALRSRTAGWLERWEMARKISKLTRRSEEHAEAAFGVDWCKGHFGDHGQLTLSRFAERMQDLEAQLV